MSELYHHGVLGMKWGRRKAKPTGSSRSRTKKAPTKTTKKASTKTNAKRSTKKNPTKNTVQKAFSVASKVGSLTMSSALRYRENQSTYNAVSSLLTGDFGNAYTSGWESSAYRRVNDYFFGS